MIPGFTVVVTETAASGRRLPSVVISSSGMLAMPVLVIRVFENVHPSRGEGYARSSERFHRLDKNDAHREQSKHPSRCSVSAKARLGCASVVVVKETAVTRESCVRRRGSPRKSGLHRRPTRGL